MNSFLETDHILVVGGSGFIGRHLVRRCLKQTRNVFSLGYEERGPLDFLPLNAFLTGDIRVAGELEMVLNGLSFDYVFNLGGYIDHTPYFRGGRKVLETHYSGLMNLLDYIDRSRLKGFVQIGSSDEYGNLPAPQRESMREQPISPYSAAKAAATHFIQMLARTEGFPGTVLRPFLVYGPGQDEKRFLPQIISACLKKEKFKTSEGKQLRDFCYVDDVVEAAVLAALSPAAKGLALNVGSGTPMSVRAMVETIIDLTGGGNPLWGTFPYRNGENMALYPDIGLIQGLLHWNPATGLKDGLKATIDYYRTLSAA